VGTASNPQWFAIGDLNSAEIELIDARTDHLDGDAVLAFAEQVLVNAARLWEHRSPEHKRRPQASYFFDGLACHPRRPVRAQNGHRSGTRQESPGGGRRDGRGVRFDRYLITSLNSLPGPRRHQ
jgi:hypothetical protein